MNNYHIVKKGCDRGLCGRDPDADAFEEALDLLLDQPSIAQSIRYAAINWPQYLGDTECEILDAFCYPYESPYWQREIHRCGSSVQSRTYMLLVAEALE